MFQVTKRFTSGILEGIVLTETTPISYEVGEVIGPWAYGPSGYVVEAVVEVAAR